LKFVLCTIILAVLAPAWGQQRVDNANLYPRRLAVVPIAGSGTADDPKRPMFLPQTPADSRDRTGIIAFQQILSDDGNFALVELVAANRSAFAQILASTNPGVKVFEVGKHTQQEIETAFKQYKAAFSFANFHPLRLQ
jgi:hypothetical protein